MTRYIPRASVLSLIVLAVGCSVVFTGSITGELHDREAYQADESDSGISDAAVYLYTEEEPWSEDLAAWDGGGGPLPDYPTDAEGNPIAPRYFLKTVTDEDGVFTFNGFIWEDLFPQYGKSGDRKEIFLLYYREDYALTGNDTPVYIVSDVTNRLPPTLLQRIVNTAVITGTVADASSGQGIRNVNVSVYVPESWGYNESTGEMENIVWSEDPDYTLVTDEGGEYNREIEFPPEPGLEDNRGTVKIRIVFDRNNYQTSNAVDGDIIDGGWDRNGDETIDSDEDDPYYQSDWIKDGRSETMARIDMRRTDYSTTVEGRIGENLDTTPEWKNGVEVRLYIDRSDEPAQDDWDDRVYTYAIEQTEGLMQDGNYTFTEVEWDRNADTLDTKGDQTCINCYIGVDNGSGTFNLHPETIYSDSENYFEYDQTP